MSQPHPPVKTKCYNCAEPTKREARRTSDFYTDDGIIWKCDNDECVAPEKEDQRVMEKIFAAFRAEEKEPQREGRK